MVQLVVLHMNVLDFTQIIEKYVLGMATVFTQMFVNVKQDLQEKDALKKSQH